MRVDSGIAIEGKVVAEGMTATVAPSAQEQAELLAALEDAGCADGISAEELFERLRRFG